MGQDKIPRLDQETPLTEQDIKYFIREMDSTVGSANSGLGKLQARLALEQIRTVTNFEKSSAALSRRIYWLTWSLVALTVVIAVFTVLLWWRN